MSEIFISYSRRDIEKVKVICEEIKNVTGVTPWMDMKGIETGSQFEEVIIEAIDECKILVFVISDSSLKSEWTKKEVLYAKNMEKKVCPVVIDNTKLRGWFLFNYGGTDCINYEDANQRAKMFADLASWCGKSEVSDPFAQMTGKEWASLLLSQPQFADRCAWEKLDGSDWASLFKGQPQFADRCPWEKLHGSDWASLLRYRPQFADRCAWEKLGQGDWVYLLRYQPQFADHCAWEKLDGSAWSCLLSAQPQFADRCAWGNLSCKDWYLLFLHLLFLHRPQFVDRCPWVRPLENLAACPVDTDVDWKLPLAIVQKPELLVQENIAARFEGLLKLDEDGQHYKGCWESSVIFTDDGECLRSVNPWAFVLYWRPELAERCLTFEKFNGYSRCILLMKQPQFADKWSMEELADRKAACWANLSDNDFKGGWEKLLAAQPQFAKWREGCD